VCAMHPAVLTTARWLERSTAPEPYRAAWEEQRAWVFRTIRDGAWWGTIMSESGTGGDLRRTRAVARLSAAETGNIAFGATSNSAAAGASPRT
jgi:hypothetical protein